MTRSSATPLVPEIAVTDLHAALLRGDELVLVDVRERDEWEICRIEPSRHLPLSRLAVRWDEIPRDRDTVVVCHHGVRSASVVAHLRSRGYGRVTSLRGGIDAWAREVDPTMSKY